MKNRVKNASGTKINFQMIEQVQQIHQLCKLFPIFYNFAPFHRLALSLAGGTLSIRGNSFLLRSQRSKTLSCTQCLVLIYMTCWQLSSIQTTIAF